jgi:hypothetical protein
MIGAVIMKITINNIITSINETTLISALNAHAVTTATSAHARQIRPFAHHERDQFRAESLERVVEPIESCSKHVVPEGGGNRDESARRGRDQRNGNTRSHGRDVARALVGDTHERAMTPSTVPRDRSAGSRSHVASHGMKRPSSSRSLDDSESSTNRSASTCDPLSRAVRSGVAAIAGLVSFRIAPHAQTPP